MCAHCRDYFILIESVMNTQTIKKCESVLFSIKPLR